MRITRGLDTALDTVEDAALVLAIAKVLLILVLIVCIV